MVGESVSKDEITTESATREQDKEISESSSSGSLGGDHHRHLHDSYKSSNNIIISPMYVECEKVNVVSMGKENSHHHHDVLQQWAAIERLPTFERLKSSLFDENDDDNNDHDGKIVVSNGEAKAKRIVDVTSLRTLEKHLFIEKLIKHVEHDNRQLLQKLRKRIDRVGVKLPTMEVRFKNLSVEAKYEVVDGKPLPTLWNSLKGLIFKLPGLGSKKAKVDIIKDASGIIKPGSMTLLLGPPGCGKSTLLKALAGNSDKNLKVTGEILYNGYKMEQHGHQKSCVYISQNDLHMAEMTVRETLDFSACCQGAGILAEIMIEVIRREKEAGIIPDLDVDAYMKAISVKGAKTTLQTDYMLKILGLDVCSDTPVGDAMRRGISGGQKKRLTTGELIMGPPKALLMDEISNGLDSSTTYQIISCLQQLAHVTDATLLVSLLQPPPEVFDLFDHIILMAEGKIVYQGPPDSILKFFEDCGFQCPKTKDIADFVQEVVSKDQANYWCQAEQTYTNISADMFSEKFKGSLLWKKLNKEILKPFKLSESDKDPMALTSYSLSNWALFKACMSRELLLMRRNSFLYIFKLIQIIIVASITMTIYLRSRMGIDVIHGNLFISVLFFTLVVMFTNPFPDLHMIVVRLPVFYKQRDLFFYPAWAFALPTALLKLPVCFFDALVWTSLTYYVIGYTPEVQRFFRQLLLNFAVQSAATSTYLFIGSTLQTLDVSLMAGTLSLLVMLLFGGFMLPKPYLPIWIRWGFWLSPLTYGQIGISVNEFLAPRWQKKQFINTTIGQEILNSRGLSSFDESFFWISIGALFGFVVLFNIGFALALTFLKPPVSHGIISSEKLSQIHSKDNYASSPSKAIKKPRKGGMVLPFEPLTLVFQGVQYYVKTPLEMRKQGFAQKRLQLLSDVTGTFRPGVLTALMGVSGAGKTTLLDVLAGRKTRGVIEGEIIVGGYPKVQETFARVSGYCEQVDIHSPHITVEESVIYSAWLRLPSQIDPKTKYDFVKEVLEAIELDDVKDALVGIPGVSGLSTEQRKRLTIAVELVANPSIIFMDEPTSGLDARAAAIVMRSVKSVADMGRTIVCTIHQPSIEIFQTFEELILLSMGGHVIYSGPLGENSSKVIEYFEGVPQVPKLKSNNNPAAWILEITSTSSEANLGLDFSQVYKKSTVYKNNKALVARLSAPLSGSKQLHFPTRFSQSRWRQLKCCLWKMHLSYWRNTSYNINRFMYLMFTALLLGVVLWDHGKKINNQQSLLNILGSMYLSALFCGVNNSTAVVPLVSTERTIFYREKFAGMYSTWIYAIAQVTIEIPYLLCQTLLFTIITYPMIGYYWSAYKVSWYFYATFCNLLSYTYLGMLVVSLTPSAEIASGIQSTMFIMFNLFVGFLIPQPQIPKWWVWLYYLDPVSWVINGMLTSQYGDIDKKISVFGETQTVATFLEEFLGFHHDRLPTVAALLILFPILLSSLFAYFVSNLNFQKR